MSEVIRKALAHRSPEELLLIPVVLLIGLAILAQPTAITRLFDTPYATPIPGDSPADRILADRTPTPERSPVTAPSGDAPIFMVGTRPFTLDRRASLQCPSGSILRESPVRYPDGSMDSLRTCVTPDGSIVLWDTTSTRLRVIPGPGSLARP